MPRRDGTGPNGEGPMTGKGMGSCNSDSRQFSRGGSGRGRRCGGRGMGMGKGWRGAGQDKATGDM
ncbi:DUF5320 domain-containing protein [Fusibacter paucivorans]|uniref:DUF5320 domain-containing protein n=1 Tax=Fusibacter paucivorans TaxID=76009 RepID=A0ABS5PMC2_9FIRM|nr:DUF5320 domain-containing protein [Fusibacter paucivorans]MBS7526303.1 DUF5320 domain-containing protein [Fusibacter paucivorans]